MKTAESIRELGAEINKAEEHLLDLYEKKRKSGLTPTMPVHKRKSKFLGFFLVPDGKVKHFSIGLDTEKGDERACQLLLAKHGFAPVRKGKRITHYSLK